VLPLYDAHVHLTDAEYSSYIEHIISSLRAMKIVACSVSVDLETTKKSLSLFDLSHRDVIRQFVGIHPEYAAKCRGINNNGSGNDDGYLDKFLQIANDNIASVDGIGEIGLDGTYEAERGVPYQIQKDIFHAMLALAESRSKPVSIHSRRSLADILEILPSYRLKGALLHWFAGSKKQLAKSMEMGLYVSYGPALVYSEDKKVLLKNTDKDKILVETDGPVRYSRCFEQRPALPMSFLPSVLASIASILEVSYREAAEITSANTEAFLQGHNNYKL
jgi:TatD DNase family protein